MRLAGYEHAPGAHCGSTSLRNLSNHYGWGFDETTCFGLASGLGFHYREPGESPHRMFVGRPLWLERAFFENPGIGTTDREGEDFETAWAAVRERLEGGDPVMAFVDLFYLDYYDTTTHFAPHSLLLVGYDEDADATEAPNADADAGTGVVPTSDSEFEAVRALPLSSLRDAWSSDAVVPLSNRYLVAENDPPVGTGTATSRSSPPAGWGGSTIPCSSGPSGSPPSSTGRRPPWRWLGWSTPPTGAARRFVPDLSGRHAHPVWTASRTRRNCSSASRSRRTSASN
ncbi:hypothetical protein BRC93_16595 [Halobacteriales archaeon QS_5_70_15]|nr:MAG: hypothetical protein BRC93_16595 [Halobacteriales archaeon QS_5_70_15]